MKMVYQEFFFYVFHNPYTNLQTYKPYKDILHPAHKINILLISISILSISISISILYIYLLHLNLTIIYILYIYI